MSELEIWNELANLYLDTGILDKAIHAYRKAIEVDPGSVDAYLKLASILSQKGKHAEVIPLYQKAIEYVDDPGEQAMFWTRIGDAYYHLKDYESGIAAFEKARQLDPAAIFKAQLTPPDQTIPGAEENAAPGALDQESLPEAVEGGETGAKPEQADSLPEQLEDEEPVASPAASSPLELPDAEDATSPMLLGGPLLSAQPDQADGGETGEPLSSRVVVAEGNDEAPLAEPVDSAADGVPQAISGPVVVEETDMDLEITVEEPAVAETVPPGEKAPITLEAAASAEALGEDVSQATRPEGSSPDDAVRFLTLSVLRWMHGDEKEASDFLGRALQIVPSLENSMFKALCFNAIALIQTELEQIEAAVHSYQNAIQAAPRLIFPWNSLGKLYSRLNRFDQAVEAYQKAIKHDPEDAESWNGLGDIYFKLGRSDDSISAYQLANLFERHDYTKDLLALLRIAVELDPTSVELWNELGNIYFENKVYDQAVLSYRKAIEIMEADPAARARLWKRVGDACNLMGNHKEAFAAYTTALALDPAQEALQEVLPMLELAVQAEQGEPAPAPVELSRAEAALSADKPAAETEMHEELAQDGSDDAAFEVDHFVMDPIPDLPSPDPEPPVDYWVFDSQSMAAETPGPESQQGEGAAPAQTLQQADVDTDVVTAERSSTLAADVPGVSTLVAPVEGSVEQVAEQEPAQDADPASGIKNSEADRTVGVSEAIEEDARAPEVDAQAPTDPEAASQATIVEQIAEVSASSHRSIEDTIAAYRRVTGENPSNDRAWDALGSMFVEVGLYGEAVSAFERAISFEPGREAYHYHLGLAYAAQTRYEEAVAALEKVVELNPYHVLARCALARYYRQTGNDIRAEEHLQAARPEMEDENEYNRACFESICGNTDVALSLLKTALDKKQIQRAWALNDPDLVFVRDDARFKTILETQEALQGSD